MSGTESTMYLISFTEIYRRNNYDEEAVQESVEHKLNEEFKGVLADNSANPTIC